MLDTKLAWVGCDVVRFFLLVDVGRAELANLKLEVVHR